MSFLAYIFSFLKSVIYGCTIFFTGELTESTDVLDVLALRFLMSFAFMWLLKAVRIIKISVGIKDFFKENPRKRAMKTILLTALFEPVLYMFFETLGISMTTNITAAVILSLMPITTCIFEIIFLKENSTLVQKILLGAGIFGSIYIALNTDTSSGKDTVLGIVMLLLTVISGSLFLVFSRKSSKSFSPMEITYVSCMIGAIAFNAINVVRHIINGNILNYFEPYFSTENLIGFFVLGVLSTVIATGMNNFALSKIRTSTTEAFAGVSTLVTVAVGVVFGGEELHYYHFIGLTLIFIRMIGVSYISIKEDKEAPLNIPERSPR